MIDDAAAYNLQVNFWSGKTGPQIYADVPQAVLLPSNDSGHWLSADSFPCPQNVLKPSHSIMTRSRIRRFSQMWFTQFATVYALDSIVVPASPVDWTNLSEECKS